MLKQVNSKFYFSSIELHDLTKAWIMLSLAFTIYFLGGFSISSKFLISFVISLFIVGTAFVLHELGHKFVAQHYGCFAEFRSFNAMLWFALIASFFGIIFAAPGAVMISGPLGQRRNGIISAFGPGTNILLSLMFLVLYSITNSTIINAVFAYGASINIWLAIFNLLPIPMLDGKKVWVWNKAVYVGIFLLSIIILITTKFITNSI
jgi:Zn-dependent protease